MSKRELWAEVSDLLQEGVRTGQLDLLAGKAERDRGLARVEENSTEFLEWARGYARALAKCYGSVTVDEIRRQANICGRKPHHKNAWGCVFSRSEWEIVGRRPSKIKSNHARSISVWRLK